MVWQPLIFPDAGGLHMRLHVLLIGKEIPCLEYVPVWCGGMTARPDCGCRSRRQVQVLPGKVQILLCGSQRAK
jgi:hypothetical protein